MIPKPTTDHLDALLAAVKLPEDMAGRRTILVTLLALLPRTYDRRALVALEIHHLRAAEALQLRLISERATASSRKQQP